MSAECGTCGTDLVYGDGDYPDMFCEVCDLRGEVERLGDALTWLVSMRPYPSAECWAAAEALLVPTTQHQGGS